MIKQILVSALLVAGAAGLAHAQGAQAPTLKKFFEPGTELLDANGKWVGTLVTIRADGTALMRELPGATPAAPAAAPPAAAPGAGAAPAAGAPGAGRGGNAPAAVIRVLPANSLKPLLGGSLQINLTEDALRSLPTATL